MFYYLDHQHTPIGPHSREELLGMLHAGQLQPGTLVAEDGGAEWLPLQRLCGQNLCTTPCPYCGGELQPQMHAGAVQLPLVCPYCKEQVRPEVPDSTYYHILFALQHPFSFKGRAARREFWGMVLLSMFLVPAIHALAVGVVVCLYSGGVPPDSAATIMLLGFFLVWCIILWGFAALSVRRLRDAALPTRLVWGLAGFPLSLLMMISSIAWWERNFWDECMKEAFPLFFSIGMLSTMIIIVSAFLPSKNR